MPALFTRRSYCHVWESIILPRVLLLSREESPKPKYVSAILRHNIKVEFLGAKNAGEQSTSFVKERTLQREIFPFFFSPRGSLAFSRDLYKQEEPANVKCHRLHLPTVGRHCGRGYID